MAVYSMCWLLCVGKISFVLHFYHWKFYRKEGATCVSGVMKQSIICCCFAQWLWVCALFHMFIRVGWIILGSNLAGCDVWKYLRKGHPFLLFGSCGLSRNCRPFDIMKLYINLTIWTLVWYFVSDAFLVLLNLILKLILFSFLICLQCLNSSKSLLDLPLFCTNT